MRNTLHAIRAIEDGVDVYIFNHEPEAARVEVIHGGELGNSYEYGGGLSSVEIVLDRSLKSLQPTALEYRTHFANGVVATEVRRAAFARAENVDLAVKFVGCGHPSRAMWCVWDDHFGGDPVSEVPVVIKNNAIRRYVPFVEEAVIGFRWEW